MTGEYGETRLLTLGHRTNPWFQERSAKTLAEGELLAFDTDVNAAFGYYADISRTGPVGGVALIDEQRRLYTHAYAEIEHNLALMEPGMAFREHAERVRLEEQVLVTDDGVERLSTYSYEEALLA